MLFYSDAEPLSVCYPIGFNGSCFAVGFCNPHRCIYQRPLSLGNERGLCDTIAFICKVLWEKET